LIIIDLPHWIKISFLKAFFQCLIFLSAVCLSGKAQYSRYVVQLRDKNQTPYQISNPSVFLSDASIQRRQRQHIEIDSTDLPVNPTYLENISGIPNVLVLNYSKWLNQVLIKTTDPGAIALVSVLPFVAGVSPVATRTEPRKQDSIEVKVNGETFILKKNSVRKETGAGAALASRGMLGNAIDYGSNYAQIHLHEGEWLHNLGFLGQRMTIAVIDAGFQAYLTNPVFDSLRINNRILATYDYVNLKSSVNEENEHGAYCLSILAANQPGVMTGTAPDANYLLLKSEDPYSEFPVEEQNWIAAAEFADSAGADLITTSLGYAYFDISVFNQDYVERNGHTTMITKAANLAVAKGMIVTASAGNSGSADDESKFIGCPADGDSVIAVGATNTKGIIAGFSSWGPNSSGQIKPDLVSVGEGTVVARTDGVPALGNGTSFSNPNLAGLIVCLWQAFPEFNGHDIIDATKKSASQYKNPDNQYGYGIPNFRIAYQILLEKKLLSTVINSPDLPPVSVYPVPFGDQFTVVIKPSQTATASIQLIDAGGRILEAKTMQVLTGQVSTVQFFLLNNLPKGVYMIHYDDGHYSKTIKSIKL
jgi:serine protease AprX